MHVAGASIRQLIGETDRVLVVSSVFMGECRDLVLNIL
jgi:hypothetical protein